MVAKRVKMICPQCRADYSYVTRIENGETVKRTRRCVCGHSWTTVEQRCADVFRFEVDRVTSSFRKYLDRV